jgi:mannose-6-phosphate isomerase-like protein (cupin superfamily)
MEARVVRYNDLRPCYNAFIDTRTPGSEAKENFTIIGPGVSENPEQHVHIAEPHGFNIGGARQPPGCVNSQHSHDTAEVFVVQSGKWRFDLGEHGDDAQVVLDPGDVISLPTGMFRGFTNIGTDAGFLFAVLGGDDPGRVLSAGQSIPEGVRPMPRTTEDQVMALRRARPSEVEQLVWRAQSRAVATRIIGEHAPLGWPHPFTMDRLQVDGGDTQTPKTPEVLFVHAGSIAVEWEGGTLTLDEGDTMTVPVGLVRTLSGAGTAYSIRG